MSKRRDEVYSQMSNELEAREDVAKDATIDANEENPDKSQEILSALGIQKDIDE